MDLLILHSTPASRARAALTAHTSANPAGLAYTLIAWQNAILNQPGHGIDDVLADPACRLVAYYLAELMNVGVTFDDRAYSALHHEVWRASQLSASLTETAPG